MGLVGMLACGIFSCPAEDTFKPWFTKFIENVSVINQQPFKSDGPVGRKVALDIWSVSSMKTYYYDKLTNAGNKLLHMYGPSIMGKMLIAKMTTRFFNMGAFRLAFCNDVGSNDQMIIFIGIFNTWFPCPQIKI